MSATRVIRVTGTSEPIDIAAVLAALATRTDDTPQPSAYERWRRSRIEALRGSRAE